MPRFFLRLIAVAALLMALLPSVERLRATAAASQPNSPAAIDMQVTELIRQLGSADFTRREKAQAELRSLGLAAFDWLHAAQDSEDIEVAMRARYLLRSLPIRWAQENDALEVKEILRGYDDKDESERRNLMDQLSKLPGHQGIAALCRLARFETSNLLSKRAAMLVVQHPRISDPDQRRGIGESIAHEIGPSRRTASHWLRTYIATLADPAASIADWEAIIRDERRILHLTPEKTSPALVRDLMRWQADLLEQVGRNADAIALMQRSIEMLDGSREQLLDAVDWLMQRQAWLVVEGIAQRYPQRFGEHAILLYRLAESYTRRGQTELAEKTVAQAIAINPGNLQEHIETAYSLQERSLYDWSEREYRLVSEAGPSGSQHDLRARFLLSEMLHDLQKDLAAAKELQAIVDLLERDQNAAFMVARLGREPDTIRSRMRYFYAEHHRSQGDARQQKEQLEQAIEHDSTDADVLIAMFRLENADEAWRQKTVRLIESAAESFRSEIRQHQKEVAEAPTEETRMLYKRQLAEAYNQFAWLISNTVGDYEEALSYSRLSNELRPDTAGFLDTLGRCYYAKGDFENAVKQQARAVELEPQTQQIARQLALFQKALSESKSAAPAPPELDP